MLTCLHCHQTKGITSRGLCHSCYVRRAIRALYPTTPRMSRGVAYHEGEADPAPTATVPGTEERIQELMRRAESGERLSVDGDLTLATMGDEGTTPARPPGGSKAKGGNVAQVMKHRRYSKTPECHAGACRDMQWALARRGL